MWISGNYQQDDFYSIISDELLPGCFTRLFTVSAISNAWDYVEGFRFPELLHKDCSRYVDQRTERSDHPFWSWFLARTNQRIFLMIAAATCCSHTRVAWTSLWDIMVCYCSDIYAPGCRVWTLSSHLFWASETHPESQLKAGGVLCLALWHFRSSRLRSRMHAHVFIYPGT